jgi:hypothetical protein
MTSNDTIYIERLNNAVISIYQYGNLTIYILGNIGNLLSILVFLKRSWRKNVCVFYFLISLLLHSAYLNTVVLGTACMMGFNINAQNSSVVLCKLLNYAAFLLATLIPTILILASIDRLLISSQNVDTRLYSSKRLAYFSISISAFVWIIFNLHVLIKVNIQQLDSTTFVCTYDLSEFYLNFVNYSLSIFNCLFCFLMIILSVLSFKNVRRIRAIPRQRLKQIRSMTKKDFQLLRCLFVQIIVYISVSIIPSSYSVYQLITKHQIRTPLQEAIINFLDKFFMFVFFIFHCSSFFIFVCVSKAFRQDLKRIIWKIFGKNSVVLREEENKPNIAMQNTIIVESIVIPS